MERRPSEMLDIVPLRLPPMGDNTGLMAGPTPAPTQRPRKPNHLLPPSRMIGSSRKDQVEWATRQAIATGRACPMYGIDPYANPPSGLTNKWQPGYGAAAAKREAMRAEADSLSQLFKEQVAERNFDRLHRAFVVTREEPEACEALDALNAYCGNPANMYLLSTSLLQTHLAKYQKMRLPFERLMRKPVAYLRRRADLIGIFEAEIGRRAAQGPPPSFGPRAEMDQLKHELTMQKKRERRRRAANPELRRRVGEPDEKARRFKGAPPPARPSPRGVMLPQLVTAASQGAPSVVSRRQRASPPASPPPASLASLARRPSHGRGSPRSPVPERAASPVRTVGFRDQTKEIR